MSSVKVTAKKAIGNIIRTVIPKAVTYDWWIVGKGIGQSLPELETIKDDTFVPVGTRFVHGYCIGVGSMPREHVSNNLKFKDPFTLKIWGFYEFRTGISTKNSEDIFVDHLENIQDALTKSPRLKYNDQYDGLDGIDKHHQLQWDDELETYGFSGEKKIWIARGLITIESTKQVV